MYSSTTSDMELPTIADASVGSLWEIPSTQKYVLVMTPLTEKISNVAAWPVGDECGGDTTDSTMINLEQLVMMGIKIASGLPIFVQMIEETIAQAHADAQAAYNARQATK